MLLIQQKVTFKPNSIIVYKSIEGGRRVHNHAQNVTNANVKGRDYNGFMSDGTRRKVKEMLHTWLESVQLRMAEDKAFTFEPTFVTLTLQSAQKHTDSEIKRNMLNAFINTMTATEGKFQVKNYFWRAEKQKNGNIHFHLIIDKRIDYLLVRKAWNRILCKHGYIDAYKTIRNEEIERNKLELYENGTQKYPDGFKYNWTAFKYDTTQKKYDKYALYTKKQNQKPKNKREWFCEAQRKAFDFGVETFWNSPNSTDIKAVNKDKIKSIATYLVKYVCKTGNTPEEVEGGEGKTQDDWKVSGKLWGCSDAIRTTKNGGKTDGYYRDTLDVELRERDNVFTDSNPEMIDFLGKLDKAGRMEERKPEDKRAIVVKPIISKKTENGEEVETQIGKVYFFRGNIKEWLKRHSPVLLEAYLQHLRRTSSVLYDTAESTHSTAPPEPETEIPTAETFLMQSEFLF